MATYTQDELDALQEAYTSGALEVEFRDRKIRFRSLAELRALMDEVSAALEGRVRRRVFRAKTRGGKGL